MLQPRTAHCTKSGPGRRHKDGTKYGTSAVPPRGAWTGQRINEAANARRKVKALIGARQYRKQRRAVAQIAGEL